MGYSYDDSDDNVGDHYSDDPALHLRRGSSAFDAIEKLALVGAIALITLPAWKGIARRWRIRNPIAASDRMIDESLKETYPASDPPATRYMDIPANRR